MISDIKRALRLAGMRPIPHRPVRTSADLRDKRILLTGASSGIGAVAARKLAAEGATVISVRTRPIRIAPRKALALRALDVVAPGTLNAILEREADRLNAQQLRSPPS
ncbi:hypothetical protein BH09ACT8_BH09ACT8_07530 [soil metagenome]